ncbi:aspartoacylase [Fischerella sp. PCC 9605]|uniref:aspartoacylase n=1 Tax=Fischerella sp. PCC 9605 TaxID=1173024 RepID=UPI00047DE5EC|nr:aspartoacylase [Fischerella sp. PCC 9605]
MSKISRVVVVGSTHGNELNGIYLVKKYERSPQLIARSGFESCTLLANTRAHQLMKRYVDTDLNRCFRQQDLENTSLSTYEAQRAKEIYRRFGSQGSQPADLIVDLHTTTANMGLTLIVALQHLFNLQLASYLTSIHPSIKILCPPTQNLENPPYLDSISQFGCVFEVGPVAQGVLDATLFQQMEALVDSILDYVEACNHRTPLSRENTLTIYQTIESVDYPRNETGDLKAMIHPQLQFQDYKALHPGDPIFLTFDGQTITYEGESIVFPVFINEAAYYEKGIAMYLTKQHQCII